MGKDSDQPIGRISKQWSGLIKEAFTDSDNFGIQFPIDLDVKVKAVLMGACILIVSDKGCDLHRQPNYDLWPHYWQKLKIGLPV